MLGILFKVLLIIIAIALFCVAGYNSETETFKCNKRQTIALIPIAIFVLSLCVVRVPANNVGVYWSAVNGTQEKTLGEGIKFKAPIDKVYLIPTTVEERTIKDVTVQTKDAQSVKAEINVKFRVDKKSAFEVYKRYGDLETLKKNVVSNYSQKAIEKVTADYNVIDILGNKKNEVYKASTKELEELFEGEGVNLISLTIKDMNAGDKIEKAIEDEAVDKKEVETAEQKKAKAEKEAETKIIKAEAEAKANKLKEKTLTKEILMQEMLDKWNGELPKVTDGDSGIFNLDSMLK